MDHKIAPVVRQADSLDAALLAELGKSTFVDTFAKYNDPDDMARYIADAFSVETLTVELADPLTMFLIAELDGTACGYARLTAGGVLPSVTGSNPIELVRLYASSQWLGRGVGEALMKACLESARRLGYQTMWLGVWERNERAQAFYRKWNFQIVGTKSFRLGTDEQTDFVMELALK